MLVARVRLVFRLAIGRFFLDFKGILIFHGSAFKRFSNLTVKLIKCM